MNLLNTFCVAAVLAVTATAANAATLSIDFDGESGDGGTLVNEMGKKSYEVGGYIMEPVNLQGGLCAEGSCTIESRQTVEPTLYREDFTSFDLLSFYFLNTGNGAIGEPAANFTTLSLYSDYDDDTPFTSFDFGNELSFTDIVAEGLTISYFDGEGSDPASVQECFEAKICKNYGYVIGLQGLGDNIGKAIWTSAGDANARLDDLLVRQPDTPEIPLPAAGWLLLGGLGSLAVARRRKTA